MAYSETTHQLPDIDIRGTVQPDNVCTLPLPGDYGTAFSVILTMTVKQARQDHDDGLYLWAYVVTSVNGRDWINVAPLGEGAEKLFDANALTPASWRLSGPFGNRLAMQFASKRTNRLNDAAWRPGLWLGGEVSIGVQSL